MHHPSFFIVGAPKCGTTSLATWLAQHPQIFIPVKEPLFFSRDIQHRWVEDFDVYLRLFADAQPHHRAIGEASVYYLFSRVAIPEIERTFPGSRYIAMVRHPVDMVISLYGQYRRTFFEDAPDFATAWRWIPDRRKGRRIPPGCPDPILLDYEAWGKLGQQVQRLLDLVPRDRVLILSLDEMKHRPRDVYRRVLRFLGVDDDGRQEFPAYNPARAWRWAPLARGVRRMLKVSTRVKHRLGIPPSRGLGVVRLLAHLNERLNTRPTAPPTLPPELAEELLDTFREDLAVLEDILQHPLTSRYLNPPHPRG